MSTFTHFLNGYLKKWLSRLFLIMTLSGLLNSLNAQTSHVNNGKDSTKQIIKKGWTFGGLPILSFDSDLGVQLGALGGLYNYGDGSRYPNYDHYIYAEASFYTKGSSLFRLYYDSDRLIKNLRITSDLTYKPDHLYDFFGFNGYMSVYNPDWVNDSTKVFYKIRQNMFRFMFMLQGNITSKNFKWVAGVDFYNLDISDVDIDHLNKGKDPADFIPATDTVPTLYDHYKDWGLINENEANGGFYTAIKTGLIFDTRDNEPNPHRGVWSEILLVSAPEFMSNMSSGFLKLSVIHRQYFTVVKNLVFAYRLGFMSTIAGEAPWYAENRLYPTYLRGSSSEGLGGAKTLRGILRNRVVGKGIGYGNFEFRWRIWQSVVMKQNLSFSLSGFFDTGRVLVEMKKKEIENLPESIKSKYFEDKDGFHNSVGGGLHMAMNENFMLSVDVGKALDKRDGNIGIYIGLGYLF